MSVSLSDRVADRTVGPVRLLVLPTAVADAVSFRGSFPTAPDLGAHDDVAVGLALSLLDKGTRSRDRFALGEALDDRGARLSFYDDGLRGGVSGRALAGDLADVLGLMAEMLREPAFDADEVEKAKVKAAASVRRSTESTGAMASGAFSRVVYPADHPNAVPPPDEELAAIEALTPERIRDAHARHVPAGGMALAVVGDVDPDAVAAAAAEAFDGWAPSGAEAAYTATAPPTQPGRTAVPMADKDNLDVRIGHAVGLRRDSADFLALYAGVFALGGNFSGRLMQIVRDEMGLTYGIRAGLGGVDVAHDMDARVSVSLSRDALDAGIAATRDVVAAFVRDGITAEELARTQTTLAGRHVVGMATTGGLAARLLVNAERGFETAEIDRYPERVRALTVEEVRRVVREHLRPERMHVVAAGTADA